MRPESLPNRSNPAPETGQPKITSSAGRSHIQRASREVPSVGKGNRKAQGIGESAQELLLCNTPHWAMELLHELIPHSAKKQCSDLCNSSQSSPITHLQHHQAGGTVGEGQLSPGRAPAAPGTLRVEGTELRDAAGHSASLLFTFISLGSFLHSKAQLTCRHLPWSAALLIQGERED